MTPVLELVARRPKSAALPIPFLLWHLLSLDAPTVAALWTWFIARTAHLTLPSSSIAAMFLAVWILYAADRLLDARLLESSSTPQTLSALEARHLFHFRHRRLFRLGILLASIALVPLLLTIPVEAIHLYLIAGSLLFAWFILIHISPGKNPRRLPKELAVGVFFAAATFIPTVARVPILRPQLLAPALLFATLCSLNCLFIYAWEHPPHNHQNCHPTTRFALARLPAITILFLAAICATAIFDRPALRLTLAMALSTLLLSGLDRFRPLPRTGLRVAADLALLTPIFFLR